MRIYGYFESVKGDVYKVDMDFPKVADKPDMEIEPGGVLQFAGEDMVTIDSGVDNSLDVVQQHSATISLQARQYVPDLFTDEYKDGRVTVSRVTGGYGTADEALECVFSGWLEPRTLSQPFNEYYDDLSLDCVDCLSAMQYSPFRNVGAGTDYLTAVERAGMSTFGSLLAECLKAGCGASAGFTVYYDGSKETADGGSVFDGLSVNDMIFLGDDEDDTKTCLEVAEAVLKYLGLHIVQYGRQFFIYSWETLRKGGAKWQRLDIMDGGKDEAVPAAGGLTTITEDNVEDDGAQVDITEIFNQVALTVSTKKQDTVVVSPLDSSGRKPAMGPRHQYVTMIAADGEGRRAANCFLSLCKTGRDLNNYDGERVYKDYYVKVMRNEHWTIGSHGTDWAAEQAEKDAANPNTAVTRLSRETGALLMQVGTVDHKPGKGDTAPQTSISMEDWLVVGVNGNGNDQNPQPSDEQLQQAAPMAVYEGGTVGASYSPTENDTANYLVISGSLVLTPVMGMTNAIADVRRFDNGDEYYNGKDFDGDGYITPVKEVAGLKMPSRTNEDGRYLTFGWWTQCDILKASGYYPFADFSTPCYAMTGITDGDKGWIPYTGDCEQIYEYKTKSGDDNVSKVGILECMLVIGEGDKAKVLVEDKGEYGGADGSLSRLNWQKYKTLEECGNDKDAYYAQSFAIGINPKIGDKLIGTEFDIATNFDYTANISAEGGMAIPLPHGEKLSGKIRMEILGPVNEYWDDNIRRHKTWFRSEKWTTKAVPLLAHVGSIIVKSLSIKMYTGTEDDGDDGDIVYMSKVSHRFYNKKDGLEFTIHSGFTKSEISRYNLSDSVLVGTVCDAEGLPVQTIRDTNTGDEAKPEKLYVNAAYEEMHAPRILLTQNMQDGGGKVSPWGLYRHEALGRSFYVRDMGANLGEGSAKMVLEECW